MNKGFGKRITLTQIENAFVPAKEISDSTKFAGREEYIREAYLALISEGNNIAIVGNRGIGKSSIARQIIQMSEGDNSLLDKLNIEYDGKLDYLTIYYACGDTIGNTEQLLEKLLTTRSCLLDWIYEIDSAHKELSKLATGLEAGVPLVFKGTFSGDKTIETNTTSSIQKHSIETIFQNVIQDILNKNLAANGILIVIDEFDQIGSPGGFASFIKSLATNTPGLKFCIVGVAQDIQNLMKEHQSSDRLFAGSVIGLPPMNPDELEEIIHNAENSIENFITFEKDAIERMIFLAQGHPYIIHLLGKLAYRSAYVEPVYNINAEYINLTLSKIAEKNADPVLEGRYKKAVASSKQREIVLKALAEVVQNDGEIHTSDAYKIAIDKDVDNASQYVGQLVTEEYGTEITKIRDRYYRFKDSLFQSYVKARPSIF